MSFDTLAGLYVYAMDYHTGQGSRLYRIMSRIRATLLDRAIAAIRRGTDDPNGEWGASPVRVSSPQTKGAEMKPGMTDAMEIIGPIHDRKGADIVPPSLDQAREFARRSKAENTLRGYRADWRDFCSWCESHSQCPLPASAETVASYIAECAGRLKVGASSGD